MTALTFAADYLIYFVVPLWIAFGFLDWDCHRRVIAPFEQRVHDYLAVVPLVALSVVLVLHWQQALALVGTGPADADFSLRWKDTPLARGYLLALPLPSSGLVTSKNSSAASAAGEVWLSRTGDVGVIGWHNITTQCK